MSDLALTSLEPAPDPMAAESDLAEGISSSSRSPAQLAVRRFLRHKAAVTGSIVLLIITAAVLLAPWIAPYGETELVALAGVPRRHRLLGAGEARDRDGRQRVGDEALAIDHRSGPPMPGRR